MNDAMDVTTDMNAKTESSLKCLFQWQICLTAHSLKCYCWSSSQLIMEANISANIINDLSNYLVVFLFVLTSSMI